MQGDAGNIEARLVTVRVHVLCQLEGGCTYKLEVTRWASEPEKSRHVRQNIPHSCGDFRREKRHVHGCQ